MWNKVLYRLFLRSFFYLHVSMIHKSHLMESLNRITYWQYDSRWILFLSATTCCYIFCKWCYVFVHHCINIYNAFKILEFIKILRRLWYKLLSNHLSVHITVSTYLTMLKHYLNNFWIMLYEYSGVQNLF